MGEGRDAGLRQFRTFKPFLDHDLRIADAARKYGCRRDHVAINDLR
jgi:hypothetical protein